MAPAYKLTYFDLPALGEPIRWLFSYGGIEFDDNRVTHEEWAALKPNAPFGQLPMLEHEGKIVTQSIAISRYVGKLVGLTGNDDWEDLEIDAIADTFNDFKTKILQVVHEKVEEKKAEMLEHVKEETVPYYMDRFEEIVKENDGYFVGGHLTWVDIYVMCLMGFFKKFEIDPLADKPNLSQLHETIISNENIQDYLNKQNY